jgi:hypothetical protein
MQALWTTNCQVHRVVNVAVHYSSGQVFMQLALVHMFVCELAHTKPARPNTKNI